MKSKRRQLEVKHYSSPDIYDLWNWEPVNNEVYYLLEMDIGITNEVSSDVYSIIILTPEGIASLREKPGSLNKEFKTIIIDDYTWLNVMKIINSILENIEVINNPYFSDDLTKHFYWEYDGMR